MLPGGDSTLPLKSKLLGLIYTNTIWKNLTFSSKQIQTLFWWLIISGIISRIKIRNYRTSTVTSSSHQLPSGTLREDQGWFSLGNLSGGWSLKHLLSIQSASQMVKVCSQFLLHHNATLQNTVADPVNLEGVSRRNASNAWRPFLLLIYLFLQGHRGEYGIH